MKTWIVSLSFTLAPIAYIKAPIHWHYFHQHVKDPAECTKVCVPKGYDKELPDKYPEDAEKHECGGKCSNVDDHREEHECKPTHTCTVFCSEVCCECLAECI